MFARARFCLLLLLLITNTSCNIRVRITDTAIVIQNGVKDKGDTIVNESEMQAPRLLCREQAKHSAISATFQMVDLGGTEIVNAVAHT